MKRKLGWQMIRPPRIPRSHVRDWHRTDLCLNCGLDMETAKKIDSVCRGIVIQITGVVL